MLKTFAGVLAMSIGLVLHHSGNMTPQVLLTYMPPVVSLSAFVNSFSADEKWAPDLEGGSGYCGNGLTSNV